VIHKIEHEQALASDALAKCRRFSVLDMMILIVAGSIGLAITRPAFLFMGQDLARLKIPVLDSWPAWKGFLFGPNRFAMNLTFFCNVILLNFLFWFFLAFLVIRLRRPRATFRELVRQPGFAGAGSVVLAVLAAVALIPLGLPRIGGQIVILSAVPTAWLVLILRRTWRPEPGWIDRFGRVVCVLLTLSATLHLVVVEWLFVRS
jgi:hypothetical protein